MDEPKHHRGPGDPQTALRILNAVSSAGVLLSIYAIVVLPGKSWYLDRMVWLYEDMKHLPEYAQWLYRPAAIYPTRTRRAPGHLKSANREGAE